MADQIDFKGLADAALVRVDSLLKEWLPNGHEVGLEYKATNPTRADNKEGSFSINMVTGKWGDFATDDAGRDLVSLYAYLFCNGDQVEAAKALAEILNMPDAVPPLKRSPGPRQPQHGSDQGRAPAASSPAPEKPAEPTEDKGRWDSLLPVPDDAPPAPQAHEFRGIPPKVWRYRSQAGLLLGYVTRFNTSDGGKDVIPLTCWRHSKTGKIKWRWAQWPELRPLYGLEKLQAHPQAIVLLVEGEKCADAAQAELPPDDWITITWPGGGNAVDKADFSPLAGRRVVTWADCDAKRKKLSKAAQAEGGDPAAQPLLPVVDQPGVKAMRRAREILHALGCELLDVAIPKPLEKADGWDVADAIEEGLAGDALLTWIQERAQPWAPPAPADSGTPPDADMPPWLAEDDGYDRDWFRRLHRNEKGYITACTANVFDVLHHDPAWRGVIAYDLHAQRVVKLRPPPYASGEAGEWNDQDDTHTAMWITRRYDFAPASATVLEAIESLSRLHSFNPVQDYLNGLAPWDGVKRIGTWLQRYMGVVPESDSQAEYLKRAGAWFLMGMVARAMKPGCKFDYCLVLEGTQGKQKSTALNVLTGDAWFGDTDLDLQNKDAMVALQGKWLYEIAEMGAIARSEEKRQKSFLSRRFDEFRPHYGRRNIRLPRQVVFAGTTNEWEWNKDPTGGRRFWPAMVGTIDLAGIAADRDQLFAEALHYYQAGLRYWPTQDEQQQLFDPEQLKREIPDSFVDGLHDWVFKQVAAFSAYDAMHDGLGLDAAKMTRDVQTRIGIALRKLGCRKVEKRNGMTRFWYEPPTMAQAKATKESAPSAHTGTPSAGQQNGGIHAPF